MLESSIRTRVKNWLNSLPNSYFVVSPPGSPTGWPDIWGSLDGRFVGVETKVRGKHAKKHQEYVHRQLRKAGAIVIVAHSLDEAKRGVDLGMQK